MTETQVAPTPLEVEMERLRILDLQDTAFHEAGHAGHRAWCPAAVDVDGAKGAR